MYPSWAGDKETMINSQENRTGKNLNGPNSTVCVCFHCWAVNRLAFIKQHFTSKITASWHLTLQFKNKQLRSQHRSLPLWTETLRALAGFWGRKSNSQPQHQFLVSLSCSLCWCLHAAKQGPQPTPTWQALPCLPQLHHDQQRGPKGLQGRNNESQNRLDWKGP